MPYKVSCTSVAMHCTICTRRSLTWLSHVLPGRSDAPQRSRDGRVRQLRVLPGHMLEACVGRDLGGAWNHPLGVAESTVQLLLWGSGGSVDPGAILRRACWLACICLGLASIASGQNEIFAFPISLCTVMQQGCAGKDLCPTTGYRQKCIQCMLTHQPVTRQQRGCQGAIWLQAQA